MPVAFDRHITSLDTFLATHLNKVQFLHHRLAAVPSTSETITPLLSLEGVNAQFDTLTNQFGVVVVTVTQLSKRSTWITFSINFLHSQPSLGLLLSFHSWIKPGRSQTMLLCTTLHSNALI